MTIKVRNSSMFLSDLYKFSHRVLYPKGITKVYSTLIPRKNSYFPYSTEMIAFGYEMFVQRWLIEHFNENFFDLPLEEVLKDYKYVIESSLGVESGETKHIEALHKLGHLPCLIKALPEGTRVPMGVPVLTIENTHDDFAWVTNFLETLIISETFVTATVASMALELKKVAVNFSNITCDNNDHVPYQCHDFSQRGQHGNEAARIAGLAHLTSFVGSDTVQAAVMASNYYGADLTTENILKSVVASEHSVMQSYTKEGEDKAYSDLLDRVPTGILSLVSDTYDYFRVLTETIPNLKEKIMKRDGKLVIRPDSGKPIDIIAGVEIVDLTHNQTFKALVENTKTYDGGSTIYAVTQALESADMEAIDPSISSYTTLFKFEGAIYKLERVATTQNAQAYPHTLTPQEKGSLELLWETFGGTVNEKGYKVLDDHIGLLFGEGITVESMRDILQRMQDKGFASSNVVFGVGAYVYSVNISRDSFAQAFKSQMCVVNGEERLTFKDPITDSSKKSLKGRVAVIKEFNSIRCIDNLTTSEYEENYEKVDILKPIFLNGKRLVETSFSDIKAKIEKATL